MLSRHAIFALSILCSLLVHAGFFAIAPKVNMFQKQNLPRPIRERFQIRLAEKFQPETTQERQTNDQTLASRPSSIRDLLEREFDLLKPDQPDIEDSADLPDLENRVASESLPREHDLEQDPGFIQRIDARILEIAETTARQDIQVARRFVRPSPNRIVPKDSLPTFRSQLGPTEEGFLPIIDPPRAPRQTKPPSPETSPVDTPELPEIETEKPPYEEDVHRPKEAVERKEIEAPLEEKVAYAPVVREVREARQESEYVFLDDLLEFKLDAYAPPGEVQGYFQLRILPKDGQDLEVLPKDVTFVIDASKSISQPKLNATAAGLRRAIAQLRPDDQFNIVIFRDSSLSFRAELVPASAENIAEALRFMKGLDAKGETDVYKAILPVVQHAPRPGAPGLVMVISDGRPTTGMRDGRTIINGLTADNNLRNSIFAFGGGRTVNRYLLDLLAYRNKGASYVTPEINGIEEGLPKFFNRLREPLLIDLEAGYGRIDESEVFPRIVPDFYRGQAITVYGRYDTTQDRQFVMRLTGSGGEGQKELIFRADLRQAKTGDRDIARNWAFQKSYHLIGEIVTTGETPGLLNQLRALELKYNIRTSYSK